METRQKKDRKETERQEREREAIKAEVRKEIERDMAEGITKKTMAAPKALTHRQQIRRGENVAQRATYAPLFREAKRKIADKKAAVCAAAGALEESLEESLEEAEKEKMDLEKDYAAIVAELKPLSGWMQGTLPTTHLHSD